MGDIMPTYAKIEEQAISRLNANGRIVIAVLMPINCLRLSHRARLKLRLLKIAQPMRFVGDLLSKHLEQK